MSRQNNNFKLFIFPRNFMISSAILISKRQKDRVLINYNKKFISLI
jgi:hypothetical protein